MELVLKNEKMVINNEYKSFDKPFRVNYEYFIGETPRVITATMQLNDPVPPATPTQVGNIPAPAPVLPASGQTLIISVTADGQNSVNFNSTKNFSDYTNIIADITAGLSLIMTGFKTV